MQVLHDDDVSIDAKQNGADVTTKDIDTHGWLLVSIYTKNEGWYEWILGQSESHLPWEERK